MNSDKRQFQKREPEPIFDPWADPPEVETAIDRVEDPLENETTSEAGVVKLQPQETAISRN